MGSPSKYKCQLVEVFNQKVYCVINKELFVSDKGAPFEKIELNIPSAYSIQWMSAEGSHLAIGLKDNEYGSSARFIDALGNVIKGGADCINRTLYGIQDEKVACGMQMSGVKFATPTPLPMAATDWNTILLFHLNAATSK